MKSETPQPAAAQPLKEELKRVLPLQKKMAENVIGLAGGKPTDDAYYRGKADGIQQVMDSIAFIEERSEVQPPAAATQERFAVGTEARYRHDIETRDMVISSLNEKLARLQQPAAATQEKGPTVRCINCHAVLGVMQHWFGEHVGPFCETCFDEVDRLSGQPLQPTAAAQETEPPCETFSDMGDDSCKHCMWTEAAHDGANAVRASLRLQPAAAAPPIDQPMPKVNDGPCIQDLVVADVLARKEIGRQRYGTVLQPNNGRDALRDAYEEALDLCQYLKQTLVERDGQQPAQNRLQALAVAQARRNHLETWSQRDSGHRYVADRDEDGFDVCPHADCALAQSTLARLRALQGTER